MKRFTILTLFFTILLFSCQTKTEETGRLTWENYAELPKFYGKKSIGFAGPVTGMSRDHLIIGGGANFPEGLPWEGGPKVYYNVAYVLNTATGEFSESRLPYRIGYTANATTPLGVVAIGGEDEKGPTEQVILLQLQNEDLDVEFLPNLPKPVTNAAATAIGNTVYLAGGENKDGVSDQFYKLDLETYGNGWQELASLPLHVSHTILLSDEQSIYLIAGRARQEDGISQLYDKVFRYDIDTNAWEEKSSLPYPVSAGTGALIDNNTLAVFGGDTGETFNNTELIIKEINEETDPERREGLEREKTRIQSGHPGFSKQILYYDIAADQWIQEETIPFTTAVTTTAVRFNNSIYIPTGEIRAGVRTPQILKATIHN